MSFIPIKKGRLEYLVSDRIETPHCFTTRLGGVSEGPLASLNLGVHRGDRPEACRENYRILGEAVGFSPEDTVLTRQLHGDIVAKVGAADRGQGLFRDLDGVERDGLMTNDPQTALTAFGADCATILLYDPEKKAVAAVHSGWRGTAAGIVYKAVRQLSQAYGTRPSDLRAAIGPCIGRCCFETHREVPDAMLAALGADALPAIDRDPGRAPYGKDTHFHVDLKLLNEIWLRRAGVEDIDVCGECTACLKDRYWSHRRQGDRRGVQAAVILLKPQARSNGP